MRSIGIHIRLEDSLMSAIEKAARYQIPFFQCFLVSHKSGTLIQPTDEDKRQFLAIRKKEGGPLYLHGSYWINLAGTRYTGHQALHRELHLARQLEFTHVILHPGSAKGAEQKKEGIDALARAVNKLFSRESTLSLVLENTAHGGMSIGGDMKDFKVMLEMVDKPERVSFCIDTAHAYSYGYDMSSGAGRQEFIELLGNTIGLSSIALIHLNDTSELLGSKIDRHAMVGSGRIGGIALKEFILDDRLKEIPVLMEMPFVSEEEELNAINMVRSWHQ